MKLIEDFFTVSVYSFLNNGTGLEQDKIDEVFNEMNIDKQVFYDYDDIIYSDEEVIDALLEKEYPRKKYQVLIDYIEDNTGSFHIRIWRK